VTNPNTASGSNSTPGGGGAVSALVVVTTTASTFNATNSKNKSMSSGDAVSATH
jgi:hypothetical protein